MEPVDLAAAASSHGLPESTAAPTERPLSKLNMSLDEVIKSSRKSQRDGHRAGSQRGGSQRGPRTSRDSDSRWEHDHFGREDRRGKGTYEDRRGHGLRRGDQGGRRSARGRSRSPPSLRFTVDRDSQRRPVISPAHGQGGNDPQCRLTVSNLNHEVSKEDLQELFGLVGPIKQVHLQYDRAGRSIGMAEIVFQYRRDAQSALNRYHGVPLDGMPMRVETHSTALPLLTSSRRTTERIARVGEGERRGRQQPADLDADLDNYMMQS